MDAFQEGSGGVQDVEPGKEIAGYRIESVERQDAGGSVVRARDPAQDRVVALHVVVDEPGSVATVRFLERAHRLGGVAHPHVLPVYEARTVDGRAVAVTQAPPGRRLDEVLAGGTLTPAAATRIARQLASAAEALERAGAELPPLVPERIWVNGSGHAHLDALEARRLSAPAPPSSSAAVAGLLTRMVGGDAPPRLRAVVGRALDGAYQSPGQMEAELGDVEAGAQRRRWRRLALAAAPVAAVLVAAALALLLG